MINIPFYILVSNDDSATLDGKLFVWWWRHQTLSISFTTSCSCLIDTTRDEQEHEPENMRIWASRPWRKLFLRFTKLIFIHLSQEKTSKDEWFLPLSTKHEWESLATKHAQTNYFYCRFAQIFWMAKTREGSQSQEVTMTWNVHGEWISSKSTRWIHWPLNRSKVWRCSLLCYNLTLRVKASLLRSN